MGGGGDRMAVKEKEDNGIEGTSTKSSCHQRGDRST